MMTNEELRVRGAEALTAALGEPEARRFISLIYLEEKNLSEQAARGKYSNWATRINGDTLLALFWFVGELSTRAPWFSSYSVVSFSRRYPGPCSYQIVRTDVALESLVEIAHGRVYTNGLDEITARDRAGIESRMKELRWRQTGIVGNTGNATMSIKGAGKAPNVVPKPPDPTIKKRRDYGWRILLEFLSHKFKGKS